MLISKETAIYLLTRTDMELRCNVPAHVIFVCGKITSMLQKGRQHTTHLQQLAFPTSAAIGQLHQSDSELMHPGWAQRERIPKSACDLRECQVACKAMIQLHMGRGQPPSTMARCFIISCGTCWHRKERSLDNKCGTVGRERKHTSKPPQPT